VDDDRSFSKLLLVAAIVVLRESRCRKMGMVPFRCVIVPHLTRFDTVDIHQQLLSRWQLQDEDIHR